ncbi:uncharacterized protein V1510DRAFT_420613 [Dipodascopsis tothii]|uniref:uncharacterized protein n=1 Tax=Dipodascopsis tothii TaxID=44089 RepID=UPI0034CDCF7D
MAYILSPFSPEGFLLLVVVFVFQLHSNGYFPTYEMLCLGRLTAGPPVAWPTHTAHGACAIRHESIGACAHAAVDSTGVVYMACGSLVERRSFYPPLLRYKYSAVKDTIDAAIYVWDPSTDDVTRLELRGDAAAIPDLVVNGFDVVPDPADDSVRVLFLGNHQDRHGSVTVFRHAVGSGVLDFVGDLSEPLVHTTHALAATSATSFYVSNDHFYRSGFGRFVEDQLGPMPWSSVAHCQLTSVGGLNVTCETKAIGLAHAAGLALVDGQLLVADSKLGHVAIYDVEPSSHNLTLARTVPLGMSVQGMADVGTTGDVLVAAVPTLDTLGPGALDGDDPAEFGAAFVLSATDGFQTPHQIFADAVAGANTGYVALSPETLVGFSFARNGIQVCQI